MLATTAAMIEQFNKNNILILEEMGFEIHVIGNWVEGNPISDEKLEEFKEWLSIHNGKWFHMWSTRKPLDLINNLQAYQQVVELIQKEKYVFIHCHTPIGSVIGRLAAHKTNLKVIYTAHGFHFYKGSPIKNWILYFPIELFLSRWTDILITINNEDYKIALKRFYAKKTIKIPGVGVDTNFFSTCYVDRKRKRDELGIPENAFVLLSVGELSENKNQIVIIDALKKIKSEGKIINIVYLSVGKGYMEARLRKRILRYGLENCVKLMGYRSDVAELCKIADCFVHLSIREGLGIAPLEAMAAGLPLISSNANGMRDYTRNGITGLCINPHDVNGLVEAITYIHNNSDFMYFCATNNQLIVKDYDIKNTNSIMAEIYKSFV